jgi:DNA polymerase-4
MDILIRRFGVSYGQYLYEAARGMDESPLVTQWEPKSFSRETTFQIDVKDWQVIAKTIAELTKEVVTDLVRKGYSARTITLKIRFDDFRTITRGTTIQEYSASEDVIRRAAFACLKRIDLKRKVRLIGIRVTNLEKVEKDSLPL